MQAQTQASPVGGMQELHRVLGVRSADTGCAQAQPILHRLGAMGWGNLTKDLSSVGADTQCWV